MFQIAMVNAQQILRLATSVFAIYWANKLASKILSTFKAEGGYSFGIFFNINVIVDRLINDVCIYLVYEFCFKNQW